MKTILVPVDFSSTSLNAASYALEYAKQVGGKLMLIHAYKQPLLYPLYQGVEVSPEGMREIKKKELELKQFERQKKQAIVQAIINGALGVMNALATAPSIIAGVIMAALVVATTAVQIATIKKSEPPSMGKGGHLTSGDKHSARSDWHGQADNQLPERRKWRCHMGRWCQGDTP